MMGLEFEYTLVMFSFIATLLLTWVSIKRLRFAGLVSEDFHKEKKKKVPKVGGIAIALGFGMSLLVAYFAQESIIYPIILSAFLVSATIGLLDDLRDFSIKEKLVLSALAAVPLFMLIPLEVAGILFILIAVVVISNWTNMLAGFNGLECGLGFIAVLFLGFSSTNPMGSLILLTYAAALLGFLFFNRYPSKVFPGDVGTLPIGVILVSGYVLGAPLLVLVILLVPYFLDAALKFFSAGIMSRSMFKPTDVKEGLLYVPENSYLSLPRVILKLKPIKEWQLVAILLAMEFILGMLTLVIA